MTQSAAEIFLDHFAIRPRGPDRDVLHELGRAFAALPYENLTKLIRKHHVPPGPERRRLPDEVLADHLEHGAGGTCFALTRLFSAVLERVGYQCHPVLCDAPSRPDQHCALLVVVNGQPHLVDPGYLIHEPIPLLPLPAESPNGSTVRLVPVDSIARSYDLFTYGRRRYRVKLDPVPTWRFHSVWDASFDWTMMNGVHLCAPAGHGYAYVHDTSLRFKEPGAGHTVNIRGRETEELGRCFGIAGDLVVEAYRLVDEERTCRRAAVADGGGAQ